MNRWIQGAIKNHGKLKEYFQEREARVFQRNGKLDRDRVESYYERNRNRLHPTTKRRILLYLNQLSKPRKRR